PFALGVASGDPTSGGVVLWTRLAPKPLEPFGGMPADMIHVSWVIAEDEQLTKIVKKGQTLATPQLGHSVHVEVEGLKPGHPYFYQFRSGEAVSPIGRTRTMPAGDSLPESFKFAFASCQHYEHGYFTAYQDMLEQNPDMVIHLGDYIYEYKGQDKKVRKHLGEEIQSLDDYRIRHSQYRLDTHLNKMHASCPWLVTWDDHEFDNNCAGGISEELNADPVEYLKRRANAYQAYYEMMPLRRRSLPKGPDMTLYRTIRCGQLAEFYVLDTRQYRTDQPNGDRKSPVNDDARRPSNSLLGSQQGGWLRSQMLQSKGIWNVLAQQVMMGVVNVSRTEEAGYSMDQWPGYFAEREEIMRFLNTRRVSNPVVLTGDIHSNWVNDLRMDDLNPETPVVATEFVGTSISSGGDGSASVPYLDLLKSRNPGVKYHGIQRGYVLCTLTPEVWQSDYRVVEKVTVENAAVTKNASFVVESGKPGAHQS
ncbi:MAG: Alkaline phosphatase, partial [Planctomycetota bacterium]